MNTTKRADQIRVGDRLIRFGHVLPVLQVENTTHPKAGSVVKVTHALASVSYAPNAVVSVEASQTSRLNL